MLRPLLGSTGWATATQLNISRIGGPNWEQTHMLSHKLCQTGLSYKACWTHLSYKACQKSILWLIMHFAHLAIRPGASGGRGHHPSSVSALSGLSWWSVLLHPFLHHHPWMLHLCHCLHWMLWSYQGEPLYDSHILLPTCNHLYLGDWSRGGCLSS